MSSGSTKKIINELFLYNLYVYIYIYIYIFTLWVECSPMARETGVESQVESYERFKKMIQDASLLNTQHHKVRIKGKVEQSKERSSALSFTSV